MPKRRENMLSKPNLVAKGLRNVAQAASFLGVSKGTVRNMIAEGQLAHTKIRAVLLVPVVALEEAASKNLKDAK